MSVMLEVSYKAPFDKNREVALSEKLSRMGGRLTFREESPGTEGGPVCLTFEFDVADRAQEAADRLRSQGEHVDGPMDYGDELTPANGSKH